MVVAVAFVEMLGWVRDAMDAMGDDRKAIVVADRGIRNSPKLLRETAGLGMFYLTRVTKKVRVMMEDGEVSPFDGLSDAPGPSWRRKRRRRAAGRGRRAPRCSGWALTCSTSAWSGGGAPSVRRCSQAV